MSVISLNKDPLDDFGYPVMVIWFLASNTSKLSAFPFSLQGAYLSKVIQETGRPH